MHVCKNLRVLLKCHERAQSDTSVVLEDSRNNARKHFESIFACVQEHASLFGCVRLPRNGTWSLAYINRSQSYFGTIEAFDKSRAKFATCNVRNVCIRKMKRKKGAEERPGVLFSVFTIDEVCVCTDVHASGEVSHYLKAFICEGR